MTVQTDFLERCKALNLHDGKLSDWLDEIESLRQQLASMTADRDDCLTLAKLNFAKNEESQKQLAAALAACKLKDAAIKDLLEFATYSTCGKAHAVEAAKEALTIQPDDAALKAWLGGPVAWLEGNPEGLWFVAYSKTDKAPQKPLYSPKGLK